MTIRVDIKEILRDPVARRLLMVPVIIATQAREGITTTTAQAEAAYDAVQKEKRMKRSFVVWGRIGAGVKVDDGTLHVAVCDDVLEALQRRIERDSGLKVAVFAPDGHEVHAGRVVRSDFKVTLGTKCKGGGYNVEGSLWVGLISLE